MITHEKIISTLKRTKIFSVFKSRELERIIKQSEIITLPPNEILFKVNDPSDCLYVVLSGRMAAFTSRRDELTQRVGDVVTGEIIGEMGMLTQKPRALTVKTITEVNLLKINENVFKSQCCFAWYHSIDGNEWRTRCRR